MNIDEIKKNKPQGATGHYFDGDKLRYCKIDRGLVIQIDGAFEISRGWLKRFNKEIHKF